MNDRVPPDPPADPPTDAPADPPIDPFTLNDPEARAREERRLERERRRRESDDGRRARGGGGRDLLGGRRASGDGVPAAPPTEVRVDGERAPGETEPTPEPATAERPRTTGSHRVPGAPPSAAVRRRRIAAVVLLAAGAVALWLMFAFLQPFGGAGEGKVVVTIPKGASASQVGEILEKRGVISDGTPLVSGGTMFRLRLTLAGKSGDIPSGSYTLAGGMSYSAAIDALTASPSERGTTVVIPEGYTRDQIAGVAEDTGLKGNYRKATLSSKLIDPKQYGAQGAETLEGFLFPATYELKSRSSVEDLAQLQLQEFQRNFNKVDLDYAKSKNLTPYDVLIIASMIDREVQVSKERKLVAEVIYNRLEIGEPLGIDATIRYATGNYDEQLKESELAIDSPYNSRLVAGLPPGPIGNPGLDSIEAAADPGRGDNRWFVVKPGTCGEHVFADSEDEFNQAAERYERALEREGGSPTEC